MVQRRDHKTKEALSMSRPRRQPGRLPHYCPVPVHGPNARKVWRGGSPGTRAPNSSLASCGEPKRADWKSALLADFLSFRWHENGERLRVLSHVAVFEE